jgi:hypothetical protein
MFLNPANIIVLLQERFSNNFQTEISHEENFVIIVDFGEQEEDISPYALIVINKKGLKAATPAQQNVVKAHTRAGLKIYTIKPEFVYFRDLEM